MKKVIISLIMFGLVMALVVGVVLPIANQLKSTGQKVYDTTKDTNNNISTGP